MLNPQFIRRFCPEARWHSNLPAGRGVSFHSGRVNPGDVFFALSGANAHGLDYAEVALDAGAAFIVSDKEHPQGVLVADPLKLLLDLGRWARQQLSGPVIAITGSAGKTSTKAMVSAALAAGSSPGNFNTPLALAQVLVNRWLGGKTATSDMLVLELGIDHVGEMDVLLKLVRPSHAVLTLVAASHLSGLGDIDSVAREKSKLLKAANNKYVSLQATAYLPETLRRQCIVYGLGSPDVTNTQLCGEIIKEYDDSQQLMILGQSFTLPYPGKAMAANAVVALGLAQSLGLELSAAAKRLAKLEPEPGRLQIHKRGNLTIIDDSYNSNPASLRSALEVLRRSPKPHSAILGDMLELGTKSEALHRQVGAETLGLKQLITIGNQARFFASGHPAALHFETREALLAVPQHLPQSGTVLVKASRGIGLEHIVSALLNEEAA